MQKKKTCWIQCVCVQTYSLVISREFFIIIFFLIFGLFFYIVKCLKIEFSNIIIIILKEKEKKIRGKLQKEKEEYRAFYSWLNLHETVNKKNITAKIRKHEYFYVYLSWNCMIFLNKICIIFFFQKKTKTSYFHLFKFFIAITDASFLKNLVWFY